MRGFLGRPMATEMVNLATSERLKEMDWTKNIEICELITRDPGQSKCVIKSIKKRLGNKNANTQFLSVMLLEMLINNCGEQIHQQVMENGLLPILVKMVKKKTDLPVQERIFLLLDATQTALGGVSGKYPQYYTAYYDLVTSGVQFSHCPDVVLPEEPSPDIEAKHFSSQESHFPNDESVEKQLTTQFISDSRDAKSFAGDLDRNSACLDIQLPDNSCINDTFDNETGELHTSMEIIIEKASSVMEVLRDVLNALDPKLPQGATDEFILDLIEQCSFQKQRVMHLVMTCRDEKLVAQAIQLNEQLQQVLTHHDRLLSVCSTAPPTFHVNEEAEEEDAESLYRRIRKGKACAEDDSEDSVHHVFRSIPKEKMNRPIIRPLHRQPSDPESKPCPPSRRPSDSESKRHLTPPNLPPPPAHHMERENSFNDSTTADGSSLAGHIWGLSLQRHDGSSSGSCSTDCSERDVYGFRD